MASDSLLLVSAVSGGSVGSMFVVAPYTGDGAYPTSDAELKEVRFNTKRSSLSAVGWGLAYPDLFRTMPLFGAGVPEKFDRGWSLENSWSTVWRDAHLPTPRLARWRQDVYDGVRPAVIFNATASESGERFLIASTDAPFEGARQFSQLFPGEDMDVSTAARLSATFPYASPLARASEGLVKNAYHVGDGGYYDNSGLLSAVEWLSAAGEELKKYQVLLIVIDAKPGSAKFGSKWSWQRQLVGPVGTLLNVRSSSQQVRESIELKMARKYLADLDSRTSRGEENAIVVAMTLYVAIYTIEIDFVDRDPQVSSKQKGIVWRSTREQIAMKAVCPVLDGVQVQQVTGIRHCHLCLFVAGENRDPMLDASGRLGLGGFTEFDSRPLKHKTVPFLAQDPI